MRAASGPTRLVAVIRRPYAGAPSRHYVGLPPMGTGDPDARVRMPVARVLVVETRPDGVFLDRYDDSEDAAGDTWHQSIDEAKRQAVREYAENLGAWTEVPDAEADAVSFGFRLAEGRDG